MQEIAFSGKVIVEYQEKRQNIYTYSFRFVRPNQQQDKTATTITNVVEYSDHLNV